MLYVSSNIETIEHIYDNVFYFKICNKCEAALECISVHILKYCRLLKYNVDMYFLLHYIYLTLLVTPL